MTVVIAAAAVLFVAVVAGAVVLRRRGSSPGGVDAVGDRQHHEQRGYEAAVHDSRTVHNAAAMGDQYHR